MLPLAFLALALAIAHSTSQQHHHQLQNSSVNPFPTIDQLGHLGPISYGEDPRLIYSSTQPSLQNHFPILEPNLTSQHRQVSDIAAPFVVSRYWGNLSPMYSLPYDAFGVQSGPEIPPGCSLDQVHLLHRHGARYPTSDTLLPRFAQLIASAQGQGTFRAKGDLAFLSKWKYKLGAEALTPFGRSQMFQLGVSYRQRYGFLLPSVDKTQHHPLPVFRTTSQDRMYHSALNFAAGFFGVPAEKKYHQSILIEHNGFNNSLAPYLSCPNYLAKIRTDPAKDWKEISLRNARNRLNQLIDGLTFTIDDIATMQNLCAYETAAIGTSEFCALFTEEEWKDFEYAGDLDFWYSASFGNKFSPAIGAGWVAELLARLAKVSPSRAMFSINTTLDSNPETFPLNQTVYVDATHDTVITAVIVALNLTSLAQSGPLPTTRRLDPRSFRVAQISPFGAQLAAQVLSCPNAAGSSSSPQSIRFVLNDAVVPLNGLGGCQSSNPSAGSDSSKTGLCDLKHFIAGLQTRLSEINYHTVCFEPSTSS